VTAQLYDNNSKVPIQFTGSLEASPKLAELYKHWCLLYQLLHDSLSYMSRSEKPFQPKEIEIDSEDVTNVSSVEFSLLCEDLCQEINTWLKAESFRNIEQKLRTKLYPIDEVRVILQAQDDEVIRLPWHLWDFFEDYQNAVLAFSVSEINSVQSERKLFTGKVRILAVLGNSEGIDVQKDRRILEQLPNTEIVFLVQPRRFELDKYLWDKQGWDILFFAGHGTNSLESQTGKIFINKTETLTIAQLKNALTAAISQGLQLAIFNCCDGLGLAKKLVSLNIGQTIVMREPVPDVVAQEFLKQFLEAFASGESLYIAMRQAREKLQGLEGEFPCASWIPVICQNPAVTPITWSQLVAKSTPSPLNPFILTTGVVVTVLIFGMKMLGFWQLWELAAFDALMRARPVEAPDNRIVLVTITEADVQAQPANERRGASISEKTLDEVIGKLQQFNPRLIGLDIYRENSVSNNYKNLSALQNSNRFITVCKSGEDETDPGVPPSPDVPLQNVSFGDVVTDVDTVVRRQLLAMAPATNPAVKCKPDKSFSFRISTRYLQSQGIEATLNSDDNWLIGKKVFQSLEKNSGGYHQIDSRGYQVLLNWRTSNPFIKKFTVGDILNNKLTADLIKNRIVLIGTTAESFNDRRWFTPYTTKKLPYKQVTGVVVQAHMVSQILSAVLDNRPLLWVSPKWSEFIWIGCWSMMGCLIAWKFQHQRYSIIFLPSSYVLLHSLCVLSLTQGLWISYVPVILAFSVSYLVVIIYTKKIR
jgi:CHASE2 domain-containing sensor protein